jgi:hypothetical protein
MCRGRSATMQVLQPGFTIMRVSQALAGLALLCAACSGKSEEPAAADGGIPSVLDGGGKIPDPPNGEEACQAGACNYQTQNCPGGQTCIPTTAPPATGDWPPTCAPAGTIAAGQSCSGWNDCALGHFCAGVGVLSDGGIQPGTCRKLCCGGDWSACGADESCYQQLFLLKPGAAPGAEPIYAGADLCGPIGGCDVLDPTSCSEPGRTCQIVDPRGSVACLPEGSVELGDACSSIVRCKSGATCRGGKCRRLCRAEVGGSPACPPGDGVCVHFVGNPHLVGECTHVAL